MNGFNRTIRENSVLLDKIDGSDLAADMLEARLIGLGEVPHHVCEYYDFVRNILEYLIQKKYRVLLLAEWAFWLTPFLYRFIRGENAALDILTRGDPPDREFYGEHFFNFCRSLQQMAGMSGNRISCSGIFPFLHFFLKDRSEQVAELYPEKAKLCADIYAAISEDYGRFSQGLEQFMMDESIHAMESSPADKIVMFAGSFHCSKIPGYPSDRQQITPVFARLIDALKINALNVLLFPVDGTFGQPRRIDNRVLLTEEHCSELFPDGVKDHLRTIIRDLPGDRRIIRTADLELDSGLPEDYLELKTRADYIVSFRNVRSDRHALENNIF